MHHRISLQHLGFELAAPADDVACHHKHPLAGIVQRLRMPRPRGDMGFDYLENKEVVAVPQLVCSGTLILAT
ncbi:hypothetical protein [Sodalis sp. (in: enterobacteria)]|uniref:hypothetical protein n=1 Tax=Sodalis sp. (in: enterobacteria) TaxID=1898979 RepID=UPI003F3B4C76